MTNDTRSYKNHNRSTQIQHFCMKVHILGIPHHCHWNHMQWWLSAVQFLLFSSSSYVLKAFLSFLAHAFSLHAFSFSLLSPVVVQSFFLLSPSFFATSRFSFLGFPLHRFFSALPFLQVFSKLHHLLLVLLLCSRPASSASFALALVGTKSR